jgi:hypothetical protein
MTMAQTNSILNEPVGETYQQLINAALGRADTLLLVTRHSQPLNTSAIGILDELRPFTISVSQESEWPGTRLYDHTATVYKMRFCPEVVEIMKRAANCLFDWVRPGLPEDPCLLRSDGTPWLVTISHERDAYMCLTTDERAELLSLVPGLALSPGNNC